MEIDLKLDRTEEEWAKIREKIQVKLKQELEGNKE